MDFDRILAVKKDAQARLRSIPGVHAVAVGPKVVGGQSLQEHAVIVYVEHKRPAAEIAADELIPAAIDGVKTDVKEEEIPRLFETAQGAEEIKAENAGGSGTLGCIALSSDRSKVYALTCHHVVEATQWKKPRLTIAKVPAAAQPGQKLQVTFGGVVQAGELVLAGFTPAQAGGNFGFGAYYTVKPGDTFDGVANGVIGAVTALHTAFSASSAGPSAITLDPATNAYFADCAALGKLTSDSSDLEVTLSANQITFGGEVSGDMCGVYTNVNVGGPAASAGIFTRLAKGTALDQVAKAVAADVTSLAVPGIVATPTGSSIAITGAVEFDCVATDDLRVGQPCLCSICSRCCGPRIGLVSQARLDLDAALIQLDGGLDYLAEIDGIGFVTGAYPVQPGDLPYGPVKKSGASTDVTNNGKITALNKDGFTVTVPFGLRHYSGALQIDATDNKPFGKAGDSGAAILNSANQVVGLLVGGTDTGAIGTPIGTIQETFHIAVATASALGQHQTVPGAAFSAMNTPLRVPALAAAAPGGLRAVAVRAREAQREILETPAGREYADIVRRHAPEVRRLIDTNRRVATVWQRCGGPRMIEALIAMLSSRERAVPNELEGKPLAECVARIQKVLLRYASADLADGLRRYAPRLSQFGGLTYTQLLDTLRAGDAA